VLRSRHRAALHQRAEIAGLRRNLAVAIGNSGDGDAIAALRDHDAERSSIEDPMVQEHIAWAIEQDSLGGKRT